MGRSRIEVDLPLQLDRADSASLPSQIVGELRKAIGRGVLIAGDTMPSSRALAKSLRLSRGSVVAAYEQLAAEGYLEATRGGGTRVSTQLEDLHPTLAQAKPEKRSVQARGLGQNPYPRHPLQRLPQCLRASFVQTAHPSRMPSKFSGRNVCRQCLRRDGTNRIS